MLFLFLSTLLLQICFLHWHYCLFNVILIKLNVDITIKEVHKAHFRERFH